MLLSKIARVRRGRRPSGASARAAFTLLEVMIGIIILTVAASAAAGSMLSALALGRVNRETAVAQEAARALLEQADQIEFDELYSTFNADPNDDPGGAGTAPGANFAVPGLEVAVGDPDGLVGEVLFPTVTIAGITWLREDVVDANLGMPRDLNGDGVIDVLNHAGDYRVLPMRVRLSWRGVVGTRTVNLETMLAER